MQAFIDGGYDLTVKSGDENALMIVAALRTPNPTLVDMFISLAGCRDNDGRTALMRAVGSGAPLNEILVKVEGGIIDKKGNSALHGVGENQGETI